MHDVKRCVCRPVGLCWILSLWFTIVVDASMVMHRGFGMMVYVCIQYIIHDSMSVCLYETGVP